MEGTGSNKVFNFQEGEVLLIDKPLEWTSFDVVKKIRNAIKIKKVGHAGTLDPLASGLLILCTGRKTKKINEFQDQEKEYTGILVVGKTTPSFDLETEVENEQDISHLQIEDIKNATREFEGFIDQIPPIYSAVKINGKRAYTHARKGENVKIEPRKVEIKAFEITHIDLPNVYFRVVCSKGTYIRSLVNDYGAKLGVGAYMSQLRRTKIGDFDVENAYQLTDLIEQINALKPEE
ncbi:tRNA pseudouridine(55) synthase TruB [Flexithrix dorotheae]|uniref:tRNA pseudouridine(55) synthase TruB n=1 Tax=Flexithrix dorotheae TaxID=70993 RepID=UPI0003798A45|nr:tRNA pseudouridine(55) synthase TruB [Flexithrix dorotheae]